MKINHKKIIKWSSIALCAAFILTLAGRTAYEYNQPEPQRYGGYYNYTSDYESLSSSYDRSVRNYATVKSAKVSDIYGNVDLTIDQQYEKIADLSAKSNDFEKDENLLYESAGRNKCLIQLEAKTGLPGSRVTSLTLGVRPDDFDGVVKELSDIGTIISTKTTKTDKTAEYKNLLAERATLEKTKESYIALRARGGSLGELMSLEQKIIDVEGMLQSQDVSLSYFNSDEGLCTVNFALSEAGAIQAKSFARTFVSSAKWTVLLFIAGLGLLILTLISVCVLLLVILLGGKVYNLFVKKE